MAFDELKDGVYVLDTLVTKEGEMYINIDNVIGWLKANQSHLNNEILHGIITSLIRCKNKHKQNGY